MHGGPNYYYHVPSSWKLQYIVLILSYAPNVRLIMAWDNINNKRAPSHDQGRIFFFFFFIGKMKILLIFEDD